MASLWKLGGALMEAVSEVLAPSLSPLDEFKYNWKMVCDYLLERRGEQILIQHTDIPSHLEAMVHKLVAEETEYEDTGPCLEYLLQKRILEAATNFAQADVPRGIMNAVLRFNSDILLKVKESLLPQVQVHGAMIKLIKFAKMRFEKAPHKEDDEAFVLFLRAICNKLKEDESLVDCFLENPPAESSLSKIRSKIQEAKTGDGSKMAPPHCVLVSALLSLSLRATEPKTAHQAREALAIVFSWKSHRLAFTLVHFMNVSQTMAHHAHALYMSLPPHIALSETRDVIQSWIEGKRHDWHAWSKKDLSEYNKDTRAFISFMLWLVFVDSIIESANPLTAEDLSKAFLEILLKNGALSFLSQVTHQVVITHTQYMTACLSQLNTDSPLYDAFVSFLTGTQSMAEDRASTSSSLPFSLCLWADDPATAPLASSILSRCNDIDDQVCATTLLLLLKLLDSCSEHAFEVLVGRHLECRCAQASEEMATDPITAARILVKRMSSLMPEPYRANEDSEIYQAYFLDSKAKIARVVEKCHRWRSLIGSSREVFQYDAPRRHDATPPPTPYVPEPALALPTLQDTCGNESKNTESSDSPNENDLDAVSYEERPPLPSLSDDPLSATTLVASLDDSVLDLVAARPIAAHGPLPALNEDVASPSLEPAEDPELVEIVSSKACRGIQDVCSSPLVASLLSRVDRLLDQPPEISLLSLALLSSLLHFPRKELQSALLNELTSETLLSHLVVLSRDIASRCAEVDRHHAAPSSPLKNTPQPVSQPDAPQGFVYLKLLQARTESLGTSMGSKPVRFTRDEILLQGVVFYDEFCKELCSIVLIKSLPLLYL